MRRISFFILLECFNFLIPSLSEEIISAEFHARRDKGKDDNKKILATEVVDLRPQLVGGQVTESLSLFEAANHKNNSAGIQNYLCTYKFIARFCLTINR